MSARAKAAPAALARALLLPLGMAVAAPLAPAPAQETLAVRGGTVHTLAGDPFQGTVLVVDGIIREAGPQVAVPAGATVIDATGLHVYPGMFDAVSEIGLTEIGAVDVTVDSREQGVFNPHLMAYTAIHPATEHIPVARANGITHTMSVPQGEAGGIAGWGSLLHLDGWTVEEMSIQPMAALVLTWPELGGGGGFGDDDEEEEPFEEREEQYLRDVQQLRDWLEAARAYERATAGGAAVGRDLRLEALGPVVRGESPVLVLADDPRQIRDAVAFAEAEEIRIVIGGGERAHEVAPLLAQADVPVILGPTQAMPTGVDRPYDEAYARPGVLHAAGVRVAFGSFGASDSRTLPYEAAMGIPFGLPREVALRGVTASAAEMLGVDDRLGTLEPGKLGNLIVTDGDPLEIRTRIRHLVIRGREIDTMDRHRELYERYRSRPGAGTGR